MSDDFRGRGGSPWGSPPGGGNNNGSGRGPTPPNIDEIIKEIQDKIKKFLPGGKSSGGKSIGLILFKHLVMILSAPFMGPISKKIEDDFTGVTSQTQVSSPLTLMFRSIKISSRNLFRELLLSIPILILGLIPFIGFFSLFLLFLMQAYFAGFGNMDYTLERRFSYQKSIQFVKANKGIAIGNGLVFMLFLLIPFVGVIFIIPFSVTSATIATVKIINQ